MHLATEQMRGVGPAGAAGLAFSGSAGWADTTPAASAITAAANSASHGPRRAQPGRCERTRSSNSLLIAASLG